MMIYRVLGAIVLLGIGTYFLNFNPRLNNSLERHSAKKLSLDVVLRHIIMGITMSGINPALFASYTGAITTSTSNVYNNMLWLVMITPV